MRRVFQEIGLLGARIADAGDQYCRELGFGSNILRRVVIFVQWAIKYSIKFVEIISQARSFFFLPSMRYIEFQNSTKNEKRSESY
jgi:hypothetical protein